MPWCRTAAVYWCSRNSCRAARAMSREDSRYFRMTATPSGSVARSPRAKNRSAPASACSPTGHAVLGQAGDIGGRNALSEAFGPRAVFVGQEIRIAPHRDRERAEHPLGRRKTCLAQVARADGQEPVEIGKPVGFARHAGGHGGIAQQHVDLGAARQQGGGEQAVGRIGGEVQPDARADQHPRRSLGRRETLRGRAPAAGGTSRDAGAARAAPVARAAPAGTRSGA